MSAQPESESRVPLKLRLKAWWEGYDADELAEALGQLRADNDELSAPPPAPAPEPTEPEPDSVLEVAKNPDAWSSARVDVAQYVWGEGYCGPGGKEYVVSMSKLLALDPKMSLLDFGARLGGAGRTLAEKFGVWITGLERSEKLVEAGNEISHKKGMSNKVELKHYDPSEELTLDRNYERIISREELYTIREKAEVLAILAEHLKPDGLLLLTDYVIATEADISNPLVKEWMDSEPTRPTMVTQDELEKLVSATGLSVRVNEDLSDKHSQMIAKAWEGADKVAIRLVEEGGNQDMVSTLLKEAEFWARRAKLLSEGHLKIVRILGFKKGGGKPMMSDW